MPEDEIIGPVFIGDEVTAAGFRLAGLSTEAVAPVESGKALARAAAEFVLLGAEHAEAMAPGELDAALRDSDTLLAVIPDINGSHAPVDMEARIRGLLGIET